MKHFMKKIEEICINNEIHHHWVTYSDFNKLIHTCKFYVYKGKLVSNKFPNEKFCEPRITFFKIKCLKNINIPCGNFHLNAIISVVMLIVSQYQM